MVRVHPGEHSGKLLLKQPPRLDVQAVGQPLSNLYRRVGPWGVAPRFPGAPSAQPHPGELRGGCLGQAGTPPHLADAVGPAENDPLHDLSVVPAVRPWETWGDTPHTTGFLTTVDTNAYRVVTQFTDGRQG